jgi:hypothetical protein
MEEMLCAMALKSSNGRQTHHTVMEGILCDTVPMEGIPIGLTTSEVWLLDNCGNDISDWRLSDRSVIDSAHGCEAE